MISQKDQAIVATFSSRIRNLFPCTRIWIYGSRARGTAQAGSDMDLCLVMDSIPDGAYKKIRDVAWELGFENQIVITTLLMTSDEFEKGPMSESGLVANIRQEGIAA